LTGRTAARLGGDEFALIITHVTDVNLLAQMAERIIDQLTQKFTVKNHHVEIGCSIGIAICPDDASDAELLLKHADVAMYQAKQQGGNTYQFFISEMQTAAEATKTIEAELSHAIPHGELCLYYQPKIDIESELVVGAEALVRWKHPKRGLIGPDEFIPIAEKSGLILPLGGFVLQEACRQNRLWQEMNLPKIQVAINLSAMQLKNPKIVDQISNSLSEFHLDPEWLEVELTETAIMHDQDEGVHLIKKIQELGVCISIDDFGTGYSSFGRLKELAFDLIKIDRSFIMGIGNSNDEAIVRAMIRMAHSLNTKLLAEGVETPEQLAFLKQEGCDQFQGYFCSRPIPADEFLALIMEGRCLPKIRALSNAE